MGPWLLSLRLLLAATFVAAGCSKAIDGEATRRAVADFGVPARLTPPAAILLPLIELAVAVLLVPSWSARWGAGIACGLLLIFSAAIVVNLVRGRRPACGCFGQLHARPLSGWTLVRNIVLAAAAGLIAFPGAGVAARWPWGAPAVFTRPGALVAVVVAAGALLVFELWLIAHLFRQRGRLLLRLDAIERHLGLGDAPPDSLRSISGLPIGATAPGFEARTLTGAHTTLERLRRHGRPVLLLFADPLCPACARVWPALRGWTHDYAGTFTFAIVARQAAAERLSAEALEGVEVVMQEGDEVARPYGATMTPAAVLVRPDGTIGSDVPIGFEAIRALVVARGGASAGEAVALLGRNGAGKTTLLRTIMGLHPAAAGVIRFGDRDVTRMPAARRARAGIGYVPQGRGILPHLTVEGNLRLGLAARASDTRIPGSVFDWFPALERLRRRKGGLLSGGEAQQLSLARALVTRPKLLILDEPTEGIQPSVVQEMQDTLGRMRRELRVAILLVEQYLAFAWAVATRFHVMSGGRIVDSGETAARPHESVAHLINI